MNKPPDDAVGRSETLPPDVPDFEMIRPIGEGGFGQVWLARNLATGHLRAIKVIAWRDRDTTDPAGREIASITRLEANVDAQHPGLLTIHHVAKTARHLFYVMDPADDVSGRPASAAADYRPATLRSRLERGPLAPDQCLRYARRLLEGLAALHEAGMVHRDVKPANCLFVGGDLKLADFGLVTEADPQTSRVGTEGYMPPDGRMDARADVYAAGLVIYEMLTGFSANSFPHLGQRAEEVLDTPVLGMLNRIALRACEQQPERRFQDGREMLAELLAKESTTTRPRWPPRRQLLAACGAAFIVLVVAVALILWSPGSSGHYTKQPIIVPNGVDVSFVTHPYEATIYLDGELLTDENDFPYRTPCTVENLRPGVYHVVFRHEAREKDLDAGNINLAEVGRIERPWTKPP